MLDDVTTVTLQSAMTALAQRQRASANNIANVETPGYLAQRVSFEDSLRDAVSSGTPQDAAVTYSNSTDNAGVNGNNVNLSSEIVIDEETTMQNQLVAQALTSKYGLVSTVLHN